MASCRRRFNSDRALGKIATYRYYKNPVSFTDTNLGELQAHAQNKHVCILVHGFNNKLPDVLLAYQQLQIRMMRFGILGPKGYGLVIGFTWPGWASFVEYPLAVRSANRSAPYLRQLIDDLRPVALSIDIQTHSLGARVALSALKTPNKVFVDNLLLTAPAVDYDKFEPKKEFQVSLDSMNTCCVYHSKWDKVLRHTFPIGDGKDGMKRALGLLGPRNRAITLDKCPNVYVVDCARHVRNHGGYRDADPYLKHWQRLLSGDAMKRYEAL